MPAYSFSANLGTPLTTTFAGAQALLWPCPSRRAPKVFLLFVPGNPGLASYYIPFLSAIYFHPALCNKIEILAVSHRGHAPLPKASHPSWGSSEECMRDTAKGYGTTLSDQIRHRIAAVDAIRRCYPVKKTQADDYSSKEDGEMLAGEGGETQLVLCGHSVGAYICTQVLKKRPDAVDGVHLLFPTLSWIANTPNGRRLRPLFHPLFYTLLLPLPLFFLSLIPLIFLVPLVWLLTSQPTVAVSSTIDLLRTPGAVRNAITMAADEMKTIKSLQADVKQAVAIFSASKEGEEGGKGKAFRTYWSRGDEDGWAPSWLRTQVESELNLQRIHLPAAVPYDPFGHPIPSTVNGLSSAVGRGGGGSTNLVSSPFTSPSLSPSSPSPSPSTSPSSLRPRTRSFSLSEYRSASASMPKLQNATARRKPTGEIVIETTIDSDSSDDEADAARRRQNGCREGTHDVKASSTVCRLGIPHAFCLKYGKEMGDICARWIGQDHL